nr:hypothetical protein [Okeania sp. SIO2F4]
MINHIFTSKNPVGANGQQVGASMRIAPTVVYRAGKPLSLMDNG